MVCCVAERVITKKEQAVPICSAKGTKHTAYAQGVVEQSDHTVSISSSYSVCNSVSLQMSYLKSVECP